jgi:hypothetical protein
LRATGHPLRCTPPFSGSPTGEYRLTLIADGGGLLSERLKSAPNLPIGFRTKNSEPVVQAFWAWCDRQCHRPDLLPSSPLAKALHYALDRMNNLVYVLQRIRE